MATTTYLKLRLSSDLTADSRFNLEKIDVLGSVYGLTAAGNIVVRASGSLSLEPNSSAVGGSGSGGDLNLGTSSHDLDAINAYGPLKLRTNAWLMARGVLRAYETDSTNYIGLRAPATVAADVTFTLPGTDGSAGQVLYTDGAGAWGWASAPTGALASGRVDIGAADGTRTQVDTASVGDIAATTAGGLAYKAGSIENADVSASAAIAYSKLALGTSIVNGDISASAAIAYSKLAAATASRALVSDASGFVSASAVTATELGYVAGLTSAAQTQISARLPLAGGTMTGDLTLANDPSTSLHAATKQYVDSLVNGIKWKQAVRAATTAAGTLATDYENGDTVDGVVLATGDRLLVKNQASAADNGIYVVAASGAPARASDADAYAELNSACVLVSEGTANADKGFIQTAELTSFASNQTWTQNFGTGLYAASGEGIELSGSTFSIELDGSTLSKGASGLRVAALTASRALASDGSGNLGVSATTAAELGYLSGTTAPTGTGALVRGTAPQFTTNLDLLAAGEARFYNAGGTFYTGFKGGAAGANKIFTLPTADGSADQLLKTDGAGALGWATGATVVTTTRGDIIRRGAATDERVALGSAGKSLRAGATDPAWAWQETTSAKSAAYTITDTDGITTVLATAAANWTLDLPTATDNSGRKIKVVKVDSGTGIVTVDAEGAELILGGAATNTTFPLYTQYDWVELVCDGISWHIVGCNSTTSWVAYTPNIANATDTSVTYVWRREGDSIRVRGKSNIDECTANITIEIPLPSVLTIDTAKLSTTLSNAGPLGDTIALDTSASTYYRGQITYDSTTTVRALSVANADYYRSVIPFDWAAGDVLSVDFLVPITQFSHFR